MDEIVGMVLCAGLGTRLRPLTERVPKPAVPLANLPLVRWSLALLRGVGVRRAVVNVHHLPEVMVVIPINHHRVVMLRSVKVWFSCWVWALLLVPVIFIRPEEKKPRTGEYI